MVFINREAKNDLNEIFSGLIVWKRITLELKYCVDYVNQIIDVCNTLDHLSVHFNSQYEDHKNQGEKIHKFKRTKNTTWYIIYDYDRLSNTVYVKRIMSNHTTISEI